MILFTLPKNIVKLFHLIKDWCLSNYILINKKCLTILRKIVLTSFLLVDSLVNQSQLVHTFYGLLCSIQKRLLLFWQTKVPQLEKCSHALLSCLKTFLSFCSQGLKRLTKDPLSFPTTLVLSLLLHLVVLYVAYLLTYYT